MDFDWDEGGGAGQDNTRLYRVLGVEQTISCDEIPEVLDHLESQHHHNASALRHIRYAAQILSEPEFRRVYDAYGEAGLARLPIPPEESQGAQLELEVTMEEVYNGTEKTIQGSRSRPCSGCSGYGATGFMTCRLCGGRGQLLQQSFLGSRPVICRQCGGARRLPNPAFMCNLCRGKRLNNETIPLKLILKPGFPDKSLYNFPGQGDQQPGHPASDYLVQVSYLLPANITVREADVIYHRDITLGELLGGYRFPYRNFDGSDHWISSSANEIGRQSGYRMVKGLGLPIYNRPNEYGDLIIAFTIRYPTPEQLTPYAISTVKELLPAPMMVYAGGFPPEQRHVPIPFEEGHVTKEESRKTYSDHVDEDEREEDDEGRFARHAHCSGVLF